MPIIHILEDFSGSSAIGNSAIQLSDVEIEDQKLSSFEKGYSAGWADAIEAQNNDHARISSELTQNLLDITFTYQESLAEILQSLDEFFQILIELIIPKIMEEAFGTSIVECLMEMAGEQTDQQIDLVVPAGTGAVLRSMLTRKFSIPIRLIEDPNLTDGHVKLRIGHAAQEICGKEIIEIVKSGVRSLNHSMKKGVPCENVR